MQYLKKLFSLMKTKKKLLLFLLYFISIIASVFIVYQSAYGSIPKNELIYMKSVDPEMGLDFFYILQDSGLTLLIFILTCFIVPNIISSDFLILENNKCDYFITTRLTSAKYNKITKYYNFMTTLLMMIVTQLLIVFIIHLFCFEISFSINEIYAGATRQTTLFSNSLMLSLVIYILLSSLGYALFSQFIFSLQAYIKNIYLFRTLGLCVSLVLYIGSAVITRVISNLSGGSFLPTLTHFLNISNILTPGIIRSPVLDHHYVLFYIGTFFFYCVMTLILFHIKDRNKYGYNQ